MSSCGLLPCCRELTLFHPTNKGRTSQHMLRLEAKAAQIGVCPGGKPDWQRLGHRWLRDMRCSLCASSWQVGGSTPTPYRQDRFLAGRWPDPCPIPVARPLAGKCSDPFSKQVARTLCHATTVWGDCSLPCEGLARRSAGCTRKRHRHEKEACEPAHLLAIACCVSL